MMCNNPLQAERFRLALESSDHLPITNMHAVAEP